MIRLSFSYFLIHLARSVNGWVDNAQADHSKPVDGVLKAHIVIQTVAFAILLPIGVTLGFARSRFHVPVQSLTMMLAFIGAALGKWHGGRQFRRTLHAQLSGFVLLYLLVQAALGAHLRPKKKDVWVDGMKANNFRWTRRIHQYMGRGTPIVAWVQVMLGVTAALGFCFNDPPPADHFNQCLAHHSMGSAFVLAGFVQMALVRLRSNQRSHDALQSLVIGIWGLVNAFFNHGVFFSGGPRWSHKDQQHTSLGIFWLFGGLLGLFLSIKYPDRRNIVPGFIVCISGWSFGGHAQSLPYSTSAHQVFGTTLFLAGLARILEVSFVDPQIDRRSGFKITHAWEHVMPLLLTASGVCLMSSNEEQLHWMVDESIGNARYAIWQYTLALVLYAYGNFLIELYIRASKHGIDDWQDGNS